ncbi:lipase maturation factor family protein [Actinomycetospora sp. TBRC 11914]|uniref:lipase maturation factor family protein n=1 Tax=Actinomycetospora sp. TBRC 11914 TaxID=2729387 RepID=UPI00145DD3CB|nr:lipase maturation factor family protein [Actinomycetospora sp. TBRC 11914]NMO90467.1 lipase maturation factor family protein [Actinomycetospora sp. TBRC 11914]
MPDLGDPSYAVARWLVAHLVALVYGLGFLVVLTQFRPLAGEHGLTPAPELIARSRFRDRPSLLWWYSDRRAVALAVVGLVLAVGALVGVADLLPIGGWLAWWGVLWVLYLSFVNVGGLWYGYGWETLLLEAGFLVTFLGPPSVAPPAPILWLLVWLLFRVEFGAGLIKMRGDSCWRDLTCLDYHHETQPLPGPTSRWFHHLPAPLHRVETAANHVVQLVVPFGLFAPQPVASIAAALVVVTQAWLVASGNFAWLNLLTIVLALSAVDDGSWAHVLPSSWIAAAGGQAPLPTWFGVVALVVTALMAVLSIWPVMNMLRPGQLMNAGITPVHLGNTYGAFGTVTRHRDEVIIEGLESADDAGWRAYELPAKPGDPFRRPPQLAPYHRRLDWQLWFVPLIPSTARVWLPRLLDRLLAADPRILALFRVDPFDGRPPRAVRVRLVRYRFTTRAERRETGAFWHTEDRGVLLPARTAR